MHQSASSYATMGRPRNHPSERPIVRPLKLHADENRAVKAIAERQGLSVHAVLKCAVRKMLKELSVSGIHSPQA